MPAYGHPTATQDCGARDHGIGTEVPAPQSEFRPTGATRDQVSQSTGVTGSHNLEAALTADMDSAASSEESDLDSCLSGPPNGKYSAKKG
jgi:hypothetical protein